MRKIFVLFVIASGCVFAGSDEHCHAVAGGITTNFIDASDTLGTSTGDLAGGLGVTVLKQTPGPNTIVLRVHHHWVTQTGETLSFDDAEATLFPTPVQGFYAVSYLNGIKMNGDGTGRFKGATGTSYAWGAVDLNKRQLTLRYEGEVCYGE